jgi:hypothetical protein
LPSIDERKNYLLRATVHIQQWLAPVLDTFQRLPTGQKVLVAGLAISLLWLPVLLLSLMFVPCFFVTVLGYYLAFHNPQTLLAHIDEAFIVVTNVSIQDAFYVGLRTCHQACHTGQHYVNQVMATKMPMLRRTAQKTFHTSLQVVIVLLEYISMMVRSLEKQIVPMISQEDARLKTRR